MSVALCRQFARPDGTLSEKMVSLSQFRDLEAGWRRVALRLSYELSIEELQEIKFGTDGDVMLLREVIVERERLREAARLPNAAP